LFHGLHVVHDARDSWGQVALLDGAVFCGGVVHLVEGFLEVVQGHVLQQRWESDGVASLQVSLGFPARLPNSQDVVHGEQEAFVSAESWIVMSQNVL
jgi:hypothetical protein